MYLFLILTVLSALPALITADPSPEAIVKMINTGRRNFANKFNVANMNELENDKELWINAGNLMNKCLDKSQLSQQNSYEIVPVMEKATGSEIEKELIRLAEAYLTNPGQTKIGLSESFKCGRPLGYNLIFVMGPLNKMSAVKNGPPGSKCDEGRVNRNGLCVKKQ